MNLGDMLRPAVLEVSISTLEIQGGVFVSYASNDAPNLNGIM